MTMGSAIGGSEHGQIHIVDIGARPIKGHDPVYRRWIENGLARLTAFDPDQQACTDLVQLYPEAAIHQMAIGDGEEHELYFTQMRSKSSLFPPNESITSLYQTFDHGMDIDARQRIKTRRLDDILDTESDFITMDIQGAEEMAIAGGSEQFGNALVVETEVEFVQQYRGQPLFGDIDCALRKCGLVFHQFTGYATRTMRPVVIDNDPTKGVNQWLWADAIYMRDPLHWDELSPDRLRKFAATIHHAYASWDIAYAALLHADKLDQKSSAARYLADVRQEPAKEAVPS